MKFYGNGVVWNPDNNSPLAKFADGVFETTDSHICGKLIALGYKHDKVAELPPVEPSIIAVELDEKALEPDVKEYHKAVKQDEITLNLDANKISKAVTASFKPKPVKKPKE